MACNQCFCLACVRTNTVALVERCGKFQAIKGPGCQCLVWPVDSIVGRVSLRVRQLDVNCETKTKDNVFVNDQPTGVACERCDATDRVELAGNLVLPSDTTAIGLDGRLVGEHAAQCVRVGHLRTCEPAP